MFIGAGVQGKAHLAAFATELGVKQVTIASFSIQAKRLVLHAIAVVVNAQVVLDANAALARCQLV